MGATGEDSGGAGTAASGLANDERESGAVYIFSRAPSESSWSQTAFIKGSHSDRADVFGTYVALSADGSTLAVGSQRDDSNAAGKHVAALSCAVPVPGAVCDVGAVDIYNRGFAGVWSHAAYLRPSVFDSEDWFGTSVALSADGRQLAVGAVGEDSAAVGIDADAGDSFGGALDFDDQGRTLAVSASLEDGSAVGVNDATPDGGAAYLY